MLDGYIPTLDGWRGIAISLVLVSHYAAALHANYSFLYGLGGVGVSVFFGISGFLICTLLLRERDSIGRISLRRFYRKRTFRIFPVAYAFLLVTLVLSFFIKLPTSFHDVWPALVFIRNYTSPDNGIAQHFWSLAVEEHFYLILPALMLLVRGRHLLAVLLIGSLLIFAWRFVAIRTMVPLPHEFFRTDFRLDALLDGAMVAVLVHNGFLKRQSSLKMSVGALSILVLSHFTAASLSRSLVAMAIPFILLSTVWSQPSIIFRTLEWAPLRWVGRLSYSIYIWQGLFTGNGLGPLGMPWGLNLVAMIGVAMLSFYLLEQPLIDWGRRTTNPMCQILPNVSLLK